MTASLDQILAAVQAVSAAVRSVNLKLDVLMSQQDQINVDVAAILDAVAALDPIEVAIKDLEAQVAAGQPVDLTGLNTAVGSLKTKLAEVGSVLPQTPPAP